MGELISLVERAEEAIPAGGGKCKIISLDEARDRQKCAEDEDIVMLPFIEGEDIGAINALKEKVGTIVGYHYLTDLISLAKQGKNIISKGNISESTLPYNIGYHLGKASKEERYLLVREINDTLKALPNTKLKEQLFYFRSKILATINN